MREWKIKRGQIQSSIFDAFEACNVAMYQLGEYSNADRWKNYEKTFKFIANDQSERSHRKKRVLSEFTSIIANHIENHCSATFSLILEEWFFHFPKEWPTKSAKQIVFEWYLNLFTRRRVKIITCYKKVIILLVWPESFVLCY